MSQWPGCYVLGKVILWQFSQLASRLVVEKHSASSIGNSGAGLNSKHFMHSRKDFSAAGG